MYATGKPDTAPWLGQHGIHAVTWGIGPNGVDNCANFLKTYVAVLAEHAGNASRLNAHVADARFGFMQHVYVADTDEQARREAGEALKVWYDNFHFLWLRYTGNPIFPFDVEAWIEQASYRSVRPNRCADRYSGCSTPRVPTASEARSCSAA